MLVRTMMRHQLCSPSASIIFTQWSTTTGLVCAISPPCCRMGRVSATQDEISWVMTFNIVATAVATPATGWLADRLGPRQVMIWAAMLFGASTFMCGTSNSLEELIFWRIVQGAAGAPLVPLGQTLLLDSSPRSQHAIVMSIFGMSNMIGPSRGPMFAGEIAATFGWRASGC
jgi:DHA2 family multidrug resistance protein